VWVIGDSHEPPGGAAFQATTAAVTAMFDGVTAARSTLGERPGATALRVSVAGANFAATEDAAASSLNSFAGDVD
jgi:hypothetical protein